MADLHQFIEGFRDFQQQYFAGETALFDRLRAGQTPTTVLIGCCDSRVDPAILTQCAPGEMFIIRNVANLVPPFEQGTTNQGVSAALQYAVTVLNVSRIVVLGHSHCGGIKALMDSADIVDKDDFLGRWIHIASKAKERVLQQLPDGDQAARYRACELEAIRDSLNNLETFPWIKARLGMDALSLHGWFFDFEHGALLGFNRESGQFQPLVSALPSQDFLIEI
ncbi:carbonic anhydrase [Iodobacter ciconiae]|uniref:Carbonic anhydrase n=1 Tax=Iodobacter ciconiae TaxID=2496266 RepID=A0A3S8ZUZ4_9NEIS|nr:carbonic anhydrase [Iodobacter ciconiae]AZN37278.1 carbonic anhydrase [Iodobacter ciconiae]